MPLPVVITYYQDKSFTFEIKTPPASYLLKQAAKIQGGSKTPGRESAGTVTMDQCREIAKKKMKDLNTSDIDAGARIIAGSARAMGLSVTGA
jgi:large subunit ribosomal protein L11